MTTKSDRTILKEIQDRLKKAIDDDLANEDRQLMLDDLKFVGIEGAQWPEDIKTQRSADGKPCLTINKMSTFIDQVVGDQRLNRPSIKVIAVDSKGDPEIARIFSGWIKHVEQISKAKSVYDHGFEQQVTCGYGAVRVITKYVDDTSFDQEAYIEKIENALAVYWGKHIEYDCSDAKYCIIITDMDRDEYKEKYKEEPMEFNTQHSQYVEGWVTKNTVRLAEYFVKEPVKTTIYELEDGRVVDEIKEGDVKVRKRKVIGFEIKRYLVSGSKVLEKDTWVGKKYIPIIPIWGKEINVGGKRKIRGLIRHAKDSQRMFNYWNSIDTEVVSLQPKIPYLVTAKQISGQERHWNQAHKKNFPYLIVNPDPGSPGWPKRETPPVASSGMIERIQSTDQEMRDTIGLQKASLGMQSNERSGRAIIERKKEGDVGTFTFVDNLIKSIEHVGRVLIDIAPGILDTERIVRLGLINGEQEFVEINKEVEKDGVIKILNDTSIGVYDVVATVGASFATQRTEARQSMADFIQYYPNAAPLIGDLYAKSMDWPGAEEVSERLEFLLPPEVKEIKAAKEAKQSGEPPPAPDPPPPPSPQELIQLEEAKLKLAQEQVKLQDGQIELQDSNVKLEQEKVKLAQEQTKLIQMQQDIEIKAREAAEPKKEEKENA